MASLHSATSGALLIRALLIGCSCIWSVAEAVHVQEGGEAAQVLHPRSQDEIPRKSPANKHKTWLPTARVSNGGKAKHEKAQDRKLCVLDPPPPNRMIYKNEDWLPVSFEIEMYPLDSTKELRVPGLTPEDALNDGMELFTEKVVKSVKRDPPDSCSDALFTVDKDDDEHAWMWELEKDEKDRPYMFEASSPQAMTENETEIAITQSVFLQKYFSKYPAKELRGKNSWEAENDPPGLHIHVASKCLLKDVRRLVAVLLIWERFDEAIYAMTGMTLHKGKAGLKAAPIDEKSPAVLNHLLSYIEKDGWKEPDDNKPLGEVYADHGSRKEMHGDKEDADGYRRFEVNVCHLLHIKCAHDLPEKEAPAVPKFGALEFRGFDPTIGEPLRLIIILVQRLVQFGCAASLDGGETLHKLAYWDGKNDADEVADLFEALEIDFADFSKEVFKEARFASMSAADKA